MTYKNREDKRAYNTKYYQRNKEKILEQSKQWQKNNSEKANEASRKWRKNNPEKNRESQRQYHKKNIEKIKERKKLRNKNNPEKNRERQKRYRKNNPEKYSKYYDRWREENRERVRKNHRQYMNMKRKTDLRFNLNHKISREIYMSLKGKKNYKKWEDLVGYTLNDLLKRLKNTMPVGYTWQDFLQGKLHIDHITPISAFNFNCPDHIDFKRCWALSNLRLLPAKENLIKGAKLNKSFQPALKI
jgi:hypothetical protein